MSLLSRLFPALQPDARDLGMKLENACAADDDCFDEKYVRRLIARGADLNVMQQRTPLYHCAAAGREALVELLLEKGAKPDTDMCGFDSPLTAAVRWGYEGIAQKLLAAGANVDHIDQHGNSALLLALFNQREDMALSLIAHGANPRLRNLKGHTPLDQARSLGLGSAVAALEDALGAEARAKQSAEEKAEADHRAALDSAGTLPDQPCRRPARFCPRL